MAKDILGVLASQEGKSTTICHLGVATVERRLGERGITNRKLTRRQRLGRCISVRKAALSNLSDRFHNLVDSRGHLNLMKT